MADDGNSVPLFWILVFLFLTLGAGAAAVMLAGGSLFGQVVGPIETVLVQVP